MKPLPAVYGIALALSLTLLPPGCTGSEGGEGADFHERTKLTWLSAIKGALKRKKQPDVGKARPGLPIVRLPEPDFMGMPLEEALRKRRSARNYSKKPVALEALSQLLFSAQGITGETYGVKLRTAPSAGGLYPMELYIFAHNVEGLPPGLYHYSPFRHSLTVLERGDYGKALLRAGLEQEMLRDAALVIALTAVPERTTWKYGERGYRYIYMEAGHIAGNVLLEAVSLGLGAVPVGAFLDDRLDMLLGIDGREEISLYLIAVGAR
jgi:SagB-type dehydrogenase family enzyme